MGATEGAPAQGDETAIAADAAVDQGSHADVSVDADRDDADVSISDAATRDSDDVSDETDTDARAVPDGPFEGGAAGDEGASDGPDSVESSMADGRSSDAPSGLRFPDSFVFGAATAGFQVEMRSKSRGGPSPSCPISRRSSRSTR